MKRPTSLTLQWMTTLPFVWIAFALLVAPAQASSDTPSTIVGKSCSAMASPVGPETTAPRGGDDIPLANFSAAASDAAVLLFQCDCPACLNALQQLRSFRLMPSTGVQGHCWTKLAAQPSLNLDELFQAVAIAEAQGPDTPLRWE